MKRLYQVIPLVLICLAGGGFTAGWAQPAAARPDETRAQPELPRQDLTIVTRDGAHHVFHVEMATTEGQQMVGLMYRPSVPQDGGMLFPWPTPHESQMWMKNTVAPLDMVFINTDGTIRHIAENTVPQSLAVIDSDGPVKATLELAAGTTRRLDIRVGDRVEGAGFSPPGPTPSAGTKLR